MAGGSSSAYYFEEITKYFLVLLGAVLGGVLIALNGITMAGMLIGLPIGIGIFYWFFKQPNLGIYLSLFQGFLLSFLGRYLPITLPLGLFVDFYLVITILVLFLKYWRSINFSLARNEMTWVMTIWMGYVFLELFNPIAASREAWFYAMRGIALYQLLIVIICFLVFNSKKQMYTFFNIWFVFSVLSVLWGLRQKYVGVDPFEQAWLDAGAGERHILFGKLRVFGFYGDAATYGAAMGHACISFLILFLGPFSRKWKVFYLLVGLGSFYALMISGTRGALAVPAIGGLAFLLMSKNIKLLSAGLILFALTFSFLKFTTIGQGNYDIARLRSALDPEDASFQARLNNRRALDNYLRGKPLGGGVGAAGNWGARFSPNTWLGQFPTDGLFTRMKAETGVIGMYLYIFMWLIILARGIYFVWKFEDDERKYLAMAVLAGFAGLLAASYTNGLLTQFPNSLVTYVGLAFVYSMRYWDRDGQVVLPEKASRAPSFEGGRSQRFNDSNLPTN